LCTPVRLMGHLASSTPPRPFGSSREMEYCFPLCVSVAFVFNHSDRCFEKGMMRPKLEASFPVGYKFGPHPRTNLRGNTIQASHALRHTATECRRNSRIFARSSMKDSASNTKAR